MKQLLIIMLTLFSFGASAQITSTCSPCTKPFGVVAILDGSDLGVGWNNDWFWGYGCSKGITVVVNGVEYFPNPNMVYPNAASAIILPGIIAPNTSYCIVVRNYCSDPFYNDPLNFIDSDQLCVTAPSATSAQPCKVGNKYVVELNGTTALVNKLRCQRLVSQGWTSSCNCQ